MVRFTFLFSLILFAAAAGAAGDVIQLLNGDTVEGRIMGGTANQVHIRVGDPARGNRVRIIDRADIAAVERNEPSPQTRPSTRELRPETSADASTTTQPNQADAEEPVELDLATHRALIIAIAKWRAQDYVGAGMDLSRLINSAKPGERQAMCDIARTGARKTLAELAADSHLRAAIATRKGAAIRLYYVTEYEKPVLMQMLASVYESALLARDEKLDISEDQEVSVDASNAAAPEAAREQPTTAGERPWYEAYSQSPPASQPADHRGDGRFAVIDWIERPEAFEGSFAQAKDLLPRVHQAISLLNERIRLDTSLRRNADLKRQILAEKKRLVTLAKVLAEHSRGSAPKPAPDPAEIAELQARRLEMQKFYAQQQEEQARELEETRKAARKWQEAQENKKSFSLFDWLKPAEQARPAEAEAPPAARD